MSECRMISPMLDNFMVGSSISDHHGVRCYPAMTKDSNQRYILKVISVPASQVQLDALLLTGAYPDEASALEYFREVADGINREFNILSDLSKQDGFVPYESVQIAPMDNGVGFDVYLLSPYKRSLERFFRKETVTHLSAVNLGLDICAALTICRRAGYLYADLRPDNIFISADGRYRIGDLGFLSLSSLKYGSIPEKYVSAYTAPEMQDAFASLNDKLDIYAAGLILYQAYNGGVLPDKPTNADEPLPPPLFADYEMAEIILKACHPDPQQRWEDPMVMGQAVVSYMQRNGANDTPIVPATARTEESSANAAESPQSDEVAAVLADASVIADEFNSEEPVVQSDSDATQLHTDADVDSIIEQIRLESFADNYSENPEGFDAACLDVVSTNTSVQPEAAAADDVAFNTAFDQVPASEEIQSAAKDETAEDGDHPAAEAEALPASNEDDAENLSFLDQLVQDETAPSEAAADGVSYADVSDDVSDMLSQADALIAHELPDPVVAPEPVDVPIPDPILPEEEAAADDTEEKPSEEDTAEAGLAEQSDGDESVAVLVDVTAESEGEAAEASDTKNDAAVDEDAYEDENAFGDDSEEASPSHSKKWLIILIALIGLAGLIFGSIYFYRNYYLQTVTSLTLEGSNNQLTVHVSSGIDESLLTVVCTDAYGNKLESPVTNGIAVFSDLNPSTLYNVKVQISGMHKLNGDIADSYSTPVQISIAGTNAVTGSEAGSVIISFSASNATSDAWVLTYTNDDNEVVEHSFTGNVATISGLTVGNTYTFELASETGNFLVGETQIQYTAILPIVAEDLQVTGADNNGLAVTWNTPAGADVACWIVNCSSEAGENALVTVTENKAVFEQLDLTQAHTITVTADGMNASARFYVTANPVSVTHINTSFTDNSITLTWNCNSDAINGQWFLMCNVDGVEMPDLVRTGTKSAVISPIVPGASYAVEITLEDGSTVLGGTTRFTLPAAKEFNGYMLGYIVQNKPIAFSMCRKPDTADWSHADVDVYTTDFAPGDQAGFVLQMPSQYNVSDDRFCIMFVIRDTDGNLISYNYTTEIWRNMWLRRYAELDVPALPTAAGAYTMQIYFNGLLTHTQEFTVTE